MLPRRPPGSLSVLHVTQATYAGAARCVADLAAHQAARGWHLTIVSPIDGTLHTWAREAGVTHIPWRAGREVGPQVPAEVASLRRILRATAPDVVHLHSSKAGLAGRLALRGRVPTLFTPHGWSFGAVNGNMRASALRWERVAARWTDLFVYVSDDERRRGEAVGVLGRSRVFKNGVDLDRFAFADDGERSAARRALGLGDGPLVVCIGRLSRQKGQDLLLDAWPRVSAEVPDADLALVGEGPERRMLTARSTAHTRLVGWCDDVRPWLAAADLVAIPSRWEGLSLSLLEAMARGRAVVVTDVEGMAATVKGGILPPAGEVVASGDAVALADALVARLVDRDMGAREGRAGRARVEAGHDLQTWASAVSDVTLEMVRPTA